jgi:hypothetical protein
MLALNMEKRVTSQGMEMACTYQRRQGMVSSLEPAEGTQLCLRLDFSPWGTILDF